MAEMTMVERVARALREALVKADTIGFGVSSDKDGFVDLPELDDHSLARAAIEAMREYCPPNMKNSGWAPAWRAMIASALSETPTSPKEP